MRPSICCLYKTILYFPYNTPRSTSLPMGNGISFRSTVYAHPSIYLLIMLKIREKVKLGKKYEKFRITGLPHKLLEFFSERQEWKFKNNVDIHCIYFHLKKCFNQFLQANQHISSTFQCRKWKKIVCYLFKMSICAN